LAADDPGQVMSEPLPNALLARVGTIRRRRNLLAAAAAVAAAAAIAAASAVQGLHDATAHPARGRSGRADGHRPGD
jgi:nitrous oxide reductase